MRHVLRIGIQEVVRHRIEMQEVGRHVIRVEKSVGMPQVQIQEIMRHVLRIEMLNGGDQAVEKKGLVEDEKYVRDLKRDCQSRAGDFEVEAKDKQFELKMLEVAKAMVRTCCAPVEQPPPLRQVPSRPHGSVAQARRAPSPDTMGATSSVSAARRRSPATPAAGVVAAAAFSRAIVAACSAIISPCSTIAAACSAITSACSAIASACSATVSAQRSARPASSAWAASAAARSAATRRRVFA